MTNTAPMDSVGFCRVSHRGEEVALLVAHARMLRVQQRKNMQPTGPLRLTVRETNRPHPDGGHWHVAIAAQGVAA